MGNGLTSPPNPASEGIPSIPVASYSQQAQQAAVGLQAAGWWDSMWKAFWEHLGAGPSLVIAVFASAIDSILAGAMGLVTALQGNNTPGFFSLVAATLSDLTGVTFTSGAIQGAFKQGGAPAANAALGESFLSLLVSEMAPGTKLPTGNGVTAASAFLGYAMAFAVREGNLAFISEVLPIEANVLAGLREYGTGMADALGLGRLTRLAMAPMMKILVQDPLTWDLNQALTPTLLPVASMFKANWRNAMSGTDLNTNLAKLGYSAAAIQQLMIDSALYPTEAQMIASQRVGYIDLDALNQFLITLGYPPNTIVSYLQGVEGARSATHLDQEISAYQDLAKNRWITTDQLESDLQEQGLTETEIKWIKAGVAPYLEYQHAELSASDIQTAYEQGLIDISYYADWATRHGYSQSDSAILQYLLLLKVNKDTTADQINAWKLRIACLTAKSKGEPTAPGFDANCNPLT